MKNISAKTAVLCSDVHLSSDTTLLTNAFVNWLNEICLKKSTEKPNWLLILGDLFDAWIGDDTMENDKMRIYLVELINVLKKINVAGIKVGIIHGNRDFLIGEAFCRAIHADLLPHQVLLLQPETDSSYLLMHGDQLCTDDKEHQIFRKMVLSKNWKNTFLKKKFEDRLMIATKMREESYRSKSRKKAEIMDINVSEVEKQMRICNSDILIHGHTHKPGKYKLPSGKKRIVLPDWRVCNGQIIGGGILVDSRGVNQLSL